MGKFLQKQNVQIVPSVLVRESMRDWFKKLLKVKDQPEEKMPEFKTNDFISSLSVPKSSSPVPSSLSHSSTPLDLDNPQKIKIFIFYLTHQLILKPMTDSESYPMKFDGLTISKLNEKKDVYGFTATAEIESTPRLKDLQIRISNTRVALLKESSYNPYKMRAAIIINNPLLIAAREDKRIKEFYDGYVLELESVINHATAITYLKNLRDHTIIFSCTLEETISKVGKEALTKTQELAEALIENLENLNKVIIEEEISLTM